MLHLGIRAVIALLLVVHGFAHWNITTAWGARPAAESWLLGAAASSPGTALWGASLGAFLLAGLAIGAYPSAWWPLTIVAALVSLATIARYWQPAMALGAVVDADVLVALLWPRWPAPDLVGA